MLSRREGAVQVLTLNRPERLNAWTQGLEEMYFGLLAAAEKDPGVRAIVVTGAGRGFCAGADMELLTSIDPAEADATEQFDRAYPYRIAKPLIAAVNGAAAGLGLVQALYCDLRFTTPEAKWTTAFARRGLVAEYGISWLLPRLVGQGAALDLLLSGRVVTGTEAVALGLANRVVPAEDLQAEALAYAQMVAESCSPWSMAVMKAQVREDLHLDFAAADAKSQRLMLESFRQGDVKEGVASYVEGRLPDFEPLGSATATQRGSE